MKRIRSTFRRRRSQPCNDHVRGIRAAFRGAFTRQKHREVEDGFAFARNIWKTRQPNLPGETNRQFAERMRAA